jgi:ABC-2 type transport system permease protein
MMLIAMRIVQEKAIGTMKNLMGTPTHPRKLIIGKIVLLALVGMLDVGLAIAWDRIAIHTPFRIEMVVLLFSKIQFLLTTLGVGLLSSAVSCFQRQTLISACFILLPAISLSGFAFPIRNEPASDQLPTGLNPLRDFRAIVREIFPKRSRIVYFGPSMIALAVMGISMLALGATRFEKHLD